MFALFHALTERVKALFITTAALDFEADLLAPIGRCCSPSFPTTNRPKWFPCGPPGPRPRRKAGDR